MSTSFDPIASLRARGIDTTNHISAVTTAESHEYTKAEFERAIFEATGYCIYTEFKMQAKVLYTNFVNDVVRQHTAGDLDGTINTTRTLERSQQATEKYFSVMKWHVPAGCKVVWRRPLFDELIAMREAYLNSYAQPATKQDRAIAIVKENINLSNKQLQELFRTQLGLTANGAATYIYNIRRMLRQHPMN